MSEKKPPTRQKIPTQPEKKPSPQPTRAPLERPPLRYIDESNTKDRKSFN